MSKKNEIASLSHEDAYEQIEVMTDIERYSADGCDIVRGNHPSWGPTVLVFPPFGEVIGVPMMGNLVPEITAIKNVSEEAAPILG